MFQRTKKNQTIPQDDNTNNNNVENKSQSRSHLRHSASSLKLALSTISSKDDLTAIGYQEETEEKPSSPIRSVLQRSNTDFFIQRSPGSYSLNIKTSLSASDPNYHEKKLITLKDQYKQIENYPNKKSVSISSSPSQRKRTLSRTPRSSKLVDTPLKRESSSDNTQEICDENGYLQEAQVEEKLGSDGYSQEAQAEKEINEDEGLQEKEENDRYSQEAQAEEILSNAIQVKQNDGYSQEAQVENEDDSPKNSEVSEIEHQNISISSQSKNTFNHPQLQKAFSKSEPPIFRELSAPKSPSKLSSTFNDQALNLLLKGLTDVEEEEICFEVLRLICQEFSSKEVLTALLNTLGSGEKFLAKSESFLKDVLKEHKTFKQSMKNNPEIEEDYHWTYRSKLANQQIHQESITNSKSINGIREMIAINLDFVNTARTYGKIIISEKYLPSYKKTIKPSTIGGVAGGAKFVIRDILFKFALNPQNNMYRTDANAIKAAAHELKGLMSFLRCKPPQINVPLICLLDYRGFRMSAVSFMPIRRNETLRYGSCDVASTLPTDPEVGELMKQIGEKLKLKPHRVREESTKELKLIYTPADIEIHRSLIDGELYALDFARLMPPMHAAKDDYGAVFYKLFRSEFLVNYPIPLSPDVFVGFGSNDPLKNENNREVKEATLYLKEKVIPQFASDLEDRKSIPEAAFLKGEFHRNGINLRFMGQVRALLKNIPSKLGDILLNEMCARTISKIIDSVLRNEMKRLCVPAEDPYRRLILDFLNKSIIGDHDKFWSKPDPFKTELMSRFPGCLSEQEQDESFDLREIVNVVLILERLQELSGIHFKQELFQELATSTDQHHPKLTFVDSDIELELLVKQIDIVESAKAKLLLEEARQKVNREEKIRILYESEALSYSAASSDPKNPIKIYEWARVVSKIYNISGKSKSSKATGELKTAVKRIQDFISHFQKTQVNKAIPISLLYVYLKLLNLRMVERHKEDKNTMREEKNKLIMKVANEHLLQTLENQKDIIFAGKLATHLRKTVEIIWNNLVLTSNLQMNRTNSIWFDVVGKIFEACHNLNPDFLASIFSKDYLFVKPEVSSNPSSSTLGLSGTTSGYSSFEDFSQMKRISASDCVEETQANGRLHCLIQCLYGREKLFPLLESLLPLENVIEFRRVIRENFFTLDLNLLATLLRIKDFAILPQGQTRPTGEDFEQSKLIWSTILELTSCLDPPTSPIFQVLAQHFKSIQNPCFVLFMPQYFRCLETFTTSICSSGEVEMPLRRNSLSGSSIEPSLDAKCIFILYQVSDAHPSIAQELLSRIPSDYLQMLTLASFPIKEFKVALFDEMHFQNPILKHLLTKCCPKVELLNCEGVKDNSLVDSALQKMMEYCSNVRELRLRNCQFLTDQAMEYLVQYGQTITSLNVGLCKISDVGLEHIAKLPNLRDLDLERCEISNQGLKYLAQTCLTLTKLNLFSCTHLTEEGFAALGSLTRLVTLDLRSSEINDAALEAISQGTGGSLIHLNLADCKDVTDEGIRHIATNCPNLIELNCRGCKSLTSKSKSIIETHCRKLIPDKLTLPRQLQPRKENVRQTGVRKKQ